MKKAKIDADGICVDYKRFECAFCVRRNSTTCCRSVPKYQKRIDSWNTKMKKVSGEVTGITLSIKALTSIQEEMLSKLSGPDLDRVNTLNNIAKRRPGFGIRFMHDGVERSCFDCVHCEKTFQDEPCRKCLGGAERGVKQIFSPGLRYETYEYASNFEPKAREKEIAIQALVEKYRTVFASIKTDAADKGVSIYELLAHLLQKSV